MSLMWGHLIPGSLPGQVCLLGRLKHCVFDNGERRMLGCQMTGSRERTCKSAAILRCLTLLLRPACSNKQGYCTSVRFCAWSVTPAELHLPASSLHQGPACDRCFSGSHTGSLSSLAMQSALPHLVHSKSQSTDASTQAYCEVMDIIGQALAGGLIGNLNLAVKKKKKKKKKKFCAAILAI